MGPLPNSVSTGGAPPFGHSCPEAAAMLQSMASSSSQVKNSLNLPVAEFGDWTKDAIFLRYDVTLKNETAYIEAWKEMMDSLSTEGSVNGSYGINRSFAGNDQSTHFVYIGASDFDSLTATGISTVTALSAALNENSTKSFGITTPSGLFKIMCE